MIKRRCRANPPTIVTLANKEFILQKPIMMQNTELFSELEKFWDYKRNVWECYKKPSKKKILIAESWDIWASEMYAQTSYYPTIGISNFTKYFVLFKGYFMSAEILTFMLKAIQTVMEENDIPYYCIGAKEETNDITILTIKMIKKENKNETE